MRRVREDHNARNPAVQLGSARQGPNLVGLVEGMYVYTTDARSKVALRFRPHAPPFRTFSGLDARFGLVGGWMDGYGRFFFDS